MAKKKKPKETYIYLFPMGNMTDWARNDLFRRNGVSFSRNANAYSRYNLEGNKMVGGLRLIGKYTLLRVTKEIFEEIQQVADKFPPWEVFLEETIGTRPRFVRDDSSELLLHEHPY